MFHCISELLRVKKVFDSQIYFNFQSQDNCFKKESSRRIHRIKIKLISI